MPAFLAYKCCIFTTLLLNSGEGGTREGRHQYSQPRQHVKMPFYTHVPENRETQPHLFSNLDFENLPVL